MTKKEWVPPRRQRFQGKVIKAPGRGKCLLKAGHSSAGVRAKSTRTYRINTEEKRGEKKH